MLAWRSLRAQLHHLVLGRVCVVTVPANYPSVGIGAVPVDNLGACGVAAPGGDMPERLGLSSADSTMARGQSGPFEVEHTVHNILPPTLRSPLTHRAPKLSVVARSRICAARDGGCSFHCD